MLVEPADRPPSETNVWDREFTWTLMNQLTSADDGSELRTFAYDDTGALMIQDGNLLTRDGEVLAEHGGGPETIFLNAWVTIVSQKIYKNINDGLDKIATKMDADASFETKSLYLHNDLVGSTNIVTDNQGRGFQRHEYFPSGEIWINDHKEEIRTPFQFGDGYYEEHFEIVLFGARWYDTERELFLAPDPLLSTDPRATIERPGLLGAYTYAGAAPVINVDPTGLDFFGAHQRVAVKARAQEAFDLDQFVLKITGEGDLAQKKADQRQKLLDKQATRRRGARAQRAHQDRPQRRHGLPRAAVRPAQGMVDERRQLRQPGRAVARRAGQRRLEVRRLPGRHRRLGRPERRRRRGSGRLRSRFGQRRRRRGRRGRPRRRQLRRRRRGRARHRTPHRSTNNRRPRPSITAPPATATTEETADRRSSSRSKRQDEPPAGATGPGRPQPHSSGDFAQPVHDPLVRGHVGRWGLLDEIEVRSDRPVRAGASAT